MGLTVFDRCLWLFDLILGCRTDIWLMKDNGAEISWSKLISVEQPGICRSINVVHVAFSNTQKDLLLVAEDDTFMWFNHVKNEVKNVTINGFPDSFNLLVYTESLVQLSYSDGKESEEKKRKKQPEDIMKRKASREKNKGIEVTALIQDRSRRMEKKWLGKIFDFVLASFIFIFFLSLQVRFINHY